MIINKVNGIDMLILYGYLAFRTGLYVSALEITSGTKIYIVKTVPRDRKNKTNIKHEQQLITPARQQLVTFLVLCSIQTKIRSTYCKQEEPKILYQCITKRNQEDYGP